MSQGLSHGVSADEVNLGKQSFDSAYWDRSVVDCKLGNTQERLLHCFWLSIAWFSHGDSFQGG